MKPLYMRHEPIEIISADGTVLAGTLSLSLSLSLSLPRWARPRAGGPLDGSQLAPACPRAPAGGSLALQRCGKCG
jgi:hypothetical protein